MNFEDNTIAIKRLGASIKSKRVAIITHNNPDPDSLASAFGLSLLLKKHFRVESKIFYGGVIGRAENRAMVRELNIPVAPYEHLDLRIYRTIALVDTQPTAGNNQLPSKTIPDIVIDHHLPVRKYTHKATYKDIRNAVGATSTIILGYLRSAGIKINRNVATALFYGIKTDTYDLGRDFINDDTEAYKYLLEKINRSKLSRIERPLHDREYFVSLHAALENARVTDDVVITVIRDLKTPDIAAEVADWLYTFQPIKWSIALGVMENKIHISIRARERKRDAGSLIKKVVGSKGMAGGHGQIAGGIVYPPKSGKEAMEAEVAHIIDRFHKELIKKDAVTTCFLIENIAKETV